MRWHEILNELQADLNQFSSTITPTRGDEFDRMKTGGGGGQKPPKPPRRGGGGGDEPPKKPEMPKGPYVINAECHDDNWTMQVHFEALDYFEIASDEELKALIDCNFRGDYASDDVAHYMAMHDPQILAITENGAGFECSIEEDDAMVWLTHYRPHLVDPDWDANMGR